MIMRSSFLKRLAPVVVAVSVVALATMGAAVPAHAIPNVSVLAFEGFASGSNLDFGPCGDGTPEVCPPGQLGDFADIVSQNAAALGVPIDPIGKFDEELEWDEGDTTEASGQFEKVFAPFENSTASVQFGFFDINDLGSLEGFLFTVEPDEPLSGAWVIVKIVTKTASGNDGIFVITNLSEVVPSSTLLQAFIPVSEYTSWSDKDLSHWSAFGTRTDEVAEPGTLLLLGTGLVVVGVIGRRRVFGRRQ